MGIGGGFFMLHYSKKNEKITVIDARETAPMKSTHDMFKNNSKTKGGLSIATPGEIKGYWLAHQMFGNLKWNKLFQPAIEMCNNGFQLPASQAKFLDYCEFKIHGSAALRETFVNKINNEIYKVNSIIKRPKLAKTLDIIAREGESAFYNGQLTDIIVDEVQSNGGIITKHDLQSYQCIVKEPIKFKLKNNIELNTVPAPGCGILLNFIMGILDGYDHDLYDDIDANTTFYHRFIEACKFGFGFRHLIGDDNFNDSTNVNAKITIIKIKL
jgi:gamma-glutamyltranspeptidase / glutathione hydrolase / leukotriene-C4 hydrolase